MITVKVNEKPRRLRSGIRLMELKKRVKPEADVVIYNGFPVTENV